MYKSQGISKESWVSGWCLKKKCYISEFPSHTPETLWEVLQWRNRMFASIQCISSLLDHKSLLWMTTNVSSWNINTHAIFIKHLFVSCPFGEPHSSYYGNQLRVTEWMNNGKNEQMPSSNTVTQIVNSGTGKESTFFLFVSWFLYQLY